MYVTAYNTSSSAVTIDGEGRAVAPGDWGPVLTTDQLVKDAFDAGTLVEVDAPRDTRNVNPDALAAHERTRVVAERAAVLDGIEKPTLFDLATAAEWDVDPDATKADLVHGLAHRDIDLPVTASDVPDETASPKSRRTARQE